MKLQCVWNDKMRFTAEAVNHVVAMDTLPPMGGDSAMTPKQLVVAAICGCTAMDVVALLKKYKQPLESFSIESETSLTEGSYPTVFKEVRLVFKIKGAVDAGKVMEAVTLSQTKYCSVSAMLSKAVPISYAVELNGVNIGSGQADFK
jgi:putative redox protein